MDTRLSGYGDHGSSLRDLPRLRDNRRGRSSSWQTNGGNDDFWTVQPGDTAVLADIAGAGCIDHIWFTTKVRSDAPYDAAGRDYLRRVVLRMYWNGEPEPSVNVPLGDFFGAIAPAPSEFTSAPLQVGPSEGRSLTGYWHMPFADGARVELVSEMDDLPVDVYFYIDYERFDALEPGVGLFHAQWRRENPCDGEPEAGRSNSEHLFGGVNLTGTGNYTILDARGRGHYVGCILNIRNLRETHEFNWYGEGDDMIFVDGDHWPPTLHGTGTEDYFGTAYCPTRPFSAPYQGLITPGGQNWSGNATMYRFHVEDPVPFRESIRVTIEHGHANRRSDDYSSVAFWYQEEPHAAFSIAAVDDRIP